VQARTISESQARTKLVQLYFASVGAAQLRDVTKLFGWSKDLVERAVKKLIEKDELVKVSHPKHEEEWLALSTL
jgi:Winged helix DNA-binding domain